MKHAIAVVGAGLGDEGKGKLVDYHAQDAELVVRHNSSAQAGHTVVTPIGERHVFSHFGSGSLQGLPTFLGEKFFVHPILFNREMRELRKLCTPRVIVDPDCHIITPWDMEMNRALEEERGPHRHGSVGIGFGEAVERIEWPRTGEFHFRVSDMMQGRNRSRHRLDRLRLNWPYARMQNAGRMFMPSRMEKFCLRPQVMENFLDDIEDFLAVVEVRPWNEVAKQYGRVVFEGAQGLLLSRRNTQCMPHLTRSDTGVSDVVSMLARVGHSQLDVTYVTRTYLTRHGAGPLPGEAPLPDWVKDDTNVPNEWQGSLRYAPLDTEMTARHIRRDRCNLYIMDKMTTTVAITCADQVQSGTLSNLTSDLRARLETNRVLFGTSPSRNDIYKA